MSEFFETYRGGVMPQHCDMLEHMTIASYYDRLGDAYVSFTERMGLGAGHRAKERKAFAAVHTFCSLKQELRSGDVLHMEGGVVGVDRKLMKVCNNIYNSSTGDLVSTFESHAIHFDLDARRAVEIPADTLAKLDAHKVPWESPMVERWFPETSDGFIPTLRDSVKMWELDILGHLSAHFYIQRFSQACMQAMARTGLTPAYNRDNRRGMSTFELDVRYLKELDGGDSVIVESAVTDLGRSSIRYVHRMINQNTGDVVATMSQYGAFLDMDARKSTPMPDEIRDKAATMLVSQS
jgi:acyl-CoA thioesterase FadM